MSCNVEQLESLLREELPKDEAARVKAHAAGCAVCTRELLWLRVEKDLIDKRHALAGPAPAHLWPAIAERAQRRRLRDYLPQHFIGYAAAAASLLFGTFAVRHALHVNAAGLGGPGLTLHVNGKQAPHEDATAATLAVSRPVRLRLGTGAADVEIGRGEAGQVRLVVSESAVRRVGLRGGVDGGVEAEFDGDGLLGDGRAALLLPAGSEVDVSTTSGEITLRGVAGKARLRTQSGDVSVNEAAALDVETTSGEVAVRGARGPVHVRTVSGGVEVDDQSGPAARLLFHTVSGQLQWSGACGADCQVEARSVSGDLQLRLAKDSSFVLRHESRSGELSDHLDLQPDAGARRFRLGAGAGQIAVTTVSGDLTLAGR